ncbi:MAG: lytic murein transglycosylase B [Burkholderiaceae bacterium]|nr:MAG: lytic murein transglycosylase B [Burkholderiaceae bacterium]
MPSSPSELSSRPHALAAVALTACLALGQALPAHARSQASPSGKTPAAAAVSYQEDPRVADLARDLAEKEGLDPIWVEQWLRQARYVPQVAQLMMPAPTGTAKNWQAYRARFVESRRIEAGRQFAQTHSRWLALAQERYGVEPEIVLGILGVETFYGRLTGGFRTLDALATLSLDFPTGRKDRTPFFRQELGRFFKLCKEQQLQPDQVKGSFAGALGLPQFMPSSWLQHAVDLDGDGHIDLLGSPADAIGSVAHYLQSFGWAPGQPTHFRIALPADTTARARMLEPDILPTFAPAQLKEMGAELEGNALAQDGKLAVGELQNGDDAPSYVAGTTNFYAITRYNWSSYYAMAVIDFGKAVRQAWLAPAAASTRSEDAASSPASAGASKRAAPQGRQAGTRGKAAPRKGAASR